MLLETVKEGSKVIICKSSCQLHNISNFPKHFYKENSQNRMVYFIMHGQVLLFPLGFSIHVFLKVSGKVHLFFCIKHTIEILQMSKTCSVCLEGTNQNTSIIRILFGYMHCSEFIVVEAN